MHCDVFLQNIMKRWNLKYILSEEDTKCDSMAKHWSLKCAVSEKLREILFCVTLGTVRKTQLRARDFPIGDEAASSHLL